MSSHDTAYYRDRANTERSRALASARKDVAAVHEELARLYQALVEQSSLRPTLRIVTDDRLMAKSEQDRSQPVGRSFAKSR